MFFMLWFTEKIKKKNQFTDQNTDIILDQSSFFWPFTEKKTENFVNYRRSYRIPYIFGQRPQAMKLQFYGKVKKYIFLFIEEPKNIILMAGKNYKFEVWQRSWGSIIWTFNLLNTSNTIIFGNLMRMERLIFHLTQLLRGPKRPHMWPKATCPMQDLE